MKKFGLGKGLESLIPKREDVVEGIRNINVNDIRPSRFQPREKFKDEEIKELADSIKEKGLLQPILVRETKDGFELISGERRLRAVKYAGLTEISAIVKTCTDNELLEISLIENLQREDLNPIEKAIGYRRLMDEFGITQEEVAKKVAKSRSEVANTIRLLNLPDYIKQSVIEERITDGHARTLLSIHDRDLQKEVFEKIEKNRLSVRQTESLAKLFTSKRKNKRRLKETKIYLKEIETRLENKLGTKVSVWGGENKGQIIIEYYSSDELERILDLIL